MQLKQLQINGFGNLNNINIELKPGVNVIKGNNESGKSTIASFIKSIFYGVNRNKAGNEFSEYDRFKPWRGSEFSGKIEYEYEGKEYSVTRDFNRNNCKVYDEEGKDITSEFNIEKSRGAEVGAMHFKVDEEIFQNSILVRQAYIKVDKQAQQYTVQKLSNIIQVGEEGTSYEKIKSKLEKILSDEVGTERTQTKPINIVNREIEKNEDIKDRLINNRNRYNLILEKKEEIEKKEDKIKKDIYDAKLVHGVKDKYSKLLEERKNSINEAIKLIQKENEENEKRQKEEKKKITMVATIILFIICIILLFLKHHLYVLVIAVLGITGLVVYTKINPKKQEIQNDKINFNINKEEIKKKEGKELEGLRNNNIKEDLIIKNVEDLKSLIENLEKVQNNYILEKHKLDIEEEAIKTNVNKLNEIEEELELAYEKKEAILKKETSLKLAIQMLDEAYYELRRDVIPNIENSIKESIAKTTNGQYTDIIYNDKEGLLIENSVGDVVTVDKLSTGTIDQIYLGFRLAIINNMDNKTPIIFDEAFVYFDDERLENIMKVIKNISEENQVIIFSCADREKNMLNNNKIRFNYVEL